jgi:putative addiction module CopG family antidote
MNVSLPMTLEDFVRRKVAAGEYQSADEVVCEALHLLQEQEVWKADASHRIDEGWEEAQAGQLRTPEEVRQSLAARKETWTQARGS